MKNKEVAKLVGILSHFVYWAVFGGFNSLPIDRYHMETMIKRMFESVESLEKKVEDHYLEKYNEKMAKKRSKSPPRSRKREVFRDDFEMRDIDYEG